MRTKLYKNWWFLTVKALLIIAAGILMLAYPSSVAGSWLPLISVLMFAGGAALLAGGLSHRRYNYEWTWWMAEGLIDTITAVLLVAAPVEPALLLPLVAGAWLMIMGILALATSINIHYYVAGNAIFIIEAVALLAGGLFLVLWGRQGSEAALTLAAILFILYGLISVYISVLLRDVVVEEIGEIEGIL